MRKPTESFWDDIGTAILILCIGLAIGGCNYLAGKSDKPCDCHEKVKP